MSERGRSGGTHKAAGWLLILVALLAAAVGVGVRFYPDLMVEWTRRPAEQLTDWWLPGALGAVCLVAFLVGCRFAFARSVKTPAQAKRAAGGNRLVEIDSPPSAPTADSASGSTPADQPVKPKEEPTFWPADQAQGLGWAKASDAVQVGQTGRSGTPSASPSQPSPPRAHPVEPL